MPSEEEGSAFLAELRDLAVLRNDKLDGRPADRALARRANVSPTTVGQWLRGKRFPQRVDEILVVVDALREEAQTRELLGDPTVASLLDERRWRNAHQAEAAQRARSTRDDVNRARARSILAANAAKERFAALPDKPRRMASWTPQQLGVHPAVGDERGKTSSLFVLPTYIERPHDSSVRQYLALLAEGENKGLVVIRGSSCTGKTRTAYEAVKAVLPEWDLVFPKDADSLLAVLAAGAFECSTILWLNEAQNFFYGKYGEAAAAALRRHLEDPGPALVIATFWPEYHRELTVTPSPGQEDSHHHARELFSQEFRIDVPASFSDAALEEVRARASKDASLSAVLGTASGSVTQFLAAAPNLVDHYEHPSGASGPYGKAVITAAMDARRLGMSGPLSLHFLETATPAYLTPEERASADPATWFTDALAYARTKIKGVASALQDVPNDSGMGAQPGVVRLADYLDQYARDIRKYRVPPQRFWSAARETLESVEELMSIAASARERWRKRVAADLYSKAAEMGSTEALRWLAFLREQAEDAESRERLTLAAVKAGDLFALRDAARWCEQNGDHAEAMRFAEEAAAAGYPTALWEVARMRKGRGDLAEAERIFWLAAEAGSPDAVTDLLRLKVKLGDAGAVDELISVLVETEDDEALFTLGLESREDGDFEAAERFFGLASEMGDVFSFVELGVMRKLAGQREEAKQIFLQAAEHIDSYALRELALLEEEDGNLEKAESLYSEVLSHGDAEAVWYVVRMYERCGDVERAEALARESADQGNFFAISQLAEHLLANDNGDRANSLLRYAIEQAGATESTSLLISLMTSKLSGETQAYARQAADGGDSYLLIEFARSMGSVEPWPQILKFGLDSDGSVASPW